MGIVVRIAVGIAVGIVVVDIENFGNLEDFGKLAMQNQNIHHLHNFELNKRKIK